MKRPDYTDPMEAARVSAFMEDAELGRWKLHHFDVDAREYNVSRLMAIMDGGDRGDLRLRRTVPPGDYILLSRKATGDEWKDIQDEKIVDSDGSPDGYVPIMSDTPSEIYEHDHAFEHAHGRVLITGLGLGVLVSALLAKEDVDEIVVIEIDRDVIALTGHYYADHPKVRIVDYDALKFGRNYAERRRPGGKRFDYAWHDIWSHISDRNLTDDRLAEHGISYATMFDAYAPFVDLQGAWAYDEAQRMYTIRRREHVRTQDWARRFLEADEEERLDMLEDAHIRRMVPQISADEPIPAVIRAFMNDQGSVRENSQRQLAARGDEMAEDMRRIMLMEFDDDEPMARPNDEPEANVAR